MEELRESMTRVYDSFNDIASGVHWLYCVAGQDSGCGDDTVPAPLNAPSSWAFFLFQLMDAVYWATRCGLWTTVTRVTKRKDHCTRFARMIPLDTTTPESESYDDSDIDGDNSEKMGEMDDNDDMDEKGEGGKKRMLKEDSQPRNQPCQHQARTERVESSRKANHNRVGTFESRLKGTDLRQSQILEKESSTSHWTHI